MTEPSSNHTDGAPSAWNRRQGIAENDPGFTPHRQTGAPVRPLQADAVKDWLWTFAQQSLDYAILLVDLDQRILWSNPGAGWVLAATASEIIGSPLMRFFTPEDIALGIPQHEAQSALHQGASDDDRWMLRADGSRFWASGRTVALARRDGTPIGYCKVFRDMSETEMRIGTLSNQARELESVNRSRGNAVAGIAHELRTLRSSLSMAAAAMARQGAHARQDGTLEIIDRSVGAVGRLVEDLEDAARIGDGRLELHVEPLLLHQVLRDAIDAVLRRMPGGGRQIQVLLPPGAPIAFEADAQRLQQLFATLIGNAIRFTADEGRVWINGTVESAQLVVRVEDDGAGIPADLLASIVDMFTSAGGATRAAGSGGGLALVRSVARQHGGSVQVASPGPGKGAQFTVRLPLRQALPRLTTPRPD